MNNDDLELITIDELCERLQIGKNAAYELLNAGKIPHAFRIRRKWKIPLRALNDFILQAGCYKQ